MTRFVDEETIIGRGVDVLTSELDLGWYSREHNAVGTTERTTCLSILLTKCGSSGSLRISDYGRCDTEYAEMSETHLCICWVVRICNSAVVTLQSSCTGRYVLFFAWLLLSRADHLVCCYQCVLSSSWSHRTLHLMMQNFIKRHRCWDTSGVNDQIPALEELDAS